MIPLTATKLESLIQEAETVGVPESELQELREQLTDLKSRKFEKKAEGGSMYKEVVRDGEKVVRVSTTPRSLDDSEDDDFKELTFKPVKRRSTRKPEDRKPEE